MSDERNYVEEIFQHYSKTPERRVQLLLSALYPAELILAPGYRAHVSVGTVESRVTLLNRIHGTFDGTERHDETRLAYVLDRLRALRDELRSHIPC